MDTFDQTVTAPRGGTSREWEVFCRTAASDPLRHVGSVSAPSAAVAREQASQLFEHAAEALWLCPADEVVRVQTESLGVGDEQDSDPTMDAPTMHAETLSEAGE